MAYIKVFPINIVITLDDIEEVFERFGEIQQTLFSTDFGSQRVALVEFVTRRSADRALEFDGERIGGDIVHVIRVDTTGQPIEDTTSSSIFGRLAGMLSSPPRAVSSSMLRGASNGSNITTTLHDDDDDDDDSYSSSSYSSSCLVHSSEIDESQSLSDEFDDNDDATSSIVLQQGHLTLEDRRRYFVLTSRRLRCFASADATRPLRSIKLDDAELAVETSGDDGLLLRNKSSVVLQLTARNASVRQAWFDELRRCTTAATAAAAARPTTIRIGKLIAAGDEQSFELIYAMLAGLRHAVGLASAQQQQQPPPTLTSDAFAARYECAFRRDSAGVAGAGALPSSFDFDFADHAPAVFAALRRLWRLDAADYLVSLTSDYALSELLTPGKSGSFFYFSVDMRFLFKTVTNGEFSTLTHMLPAYYAHVRRYASTLLPRFLGLHTLRRRGQTLHFVVMTNLFPTTDDMPIAEQYDLKGSTVGRTAGAANIARNPRTVRKDLDFHRKLHLPLRTALALQQQLSIDSEFLERHNIMDYSLLLGVCALADAPSPPSPPSPPPTDDLSAVFTAADMAALVAEMNDDSKRDRRSLFETFRGGIGATHGSGEVYFCGIIDILQAYNLRKQLEHQYKAKRFDPAGVSVTHPHAYATRFRQFMSSIILREQQQPIRRRETSIEIDVGDLAGKRRPTAPGRSSLFSTLSSLTMLRRSTPNPVIVTTPAPPTAPPPVATTTTTTNTTATAPRRRRHRRRRVAVEQLPLPEAATRRHRRNVSDGAIKRPEE